VIGYYLVLAAPVLALGVALRALRVCVDLLTDALEDLLAGR